MRQQHPCVPVFGVEERLADLLSPWEIYHEASKMRSGTSGPAVDSDDRVLASIVESRQKFLQQVYGKAGAAYRQYRNAPRTPLPLSPPRTPADLAESILARRSIRNYLPVSISLDDLSDLLRLTSGITHVSPYAGSDALLRAAPSAGGLYELETYVIASRVEGLDPGLYHYYVRGHALERLRGPEAIPEAIDATLYPEMARQASVLVIFTAVLGRLTWKYGQSSYRFAHLDAGHYAEHLSLVSVARGLGSCALGGFVCDKVASLMGVDGVSELPLYMVAVGKPDRTGMRHEGHPSTPTESLRLRRLDPLDLPCGLDSWPSLDSMLRAAFGHLAAGRVSEGREALIRCAAVLPNDATVRDYMSLSDLRGPALEVSPRAHFVFPPSWSAERRRACVDRTERAIEDTLAWLGIDKAPTVFVDFTQDRSRPVTLNRRRWVQRKIVIADADPLSHEIVHACYLPHNAFLAEGIAGAASSRPEELKEINAELAGMGKPPVDIARMFDPSSLVETFDPHTRRETDPVVYPVAASFVDFLRRRYGRDSFFRFMDAILYPAPSEEVGLQGRFFREVFRCTPAEAGEAWWKEVREARS